MYLEEMKHFLTCINGKAVPLIDGYTAKKVLEIALAAKKSANVGKAIHL
jgi:predicted dehydrogenase